MDPRWLEILKASSWQLAGLSLALGAFWLLLYFEVLPPIDHVLIVYGLPLAMLVAGSLSLVGFLEFMTNHLGTVLQKQRVKNQAVEVQRREQQSLRDYIPFMTDTEKSILGYLLRHNQKTLIASIDADRAASLLGRGFIRLGVKGKQVVDQDRVPFIVPDHLWEVLEEHRTDFPSSFKNDDTLPWITHWMAR